MTVHNYQSVSSINLYEDVFCHGTFAERHKRYTAAKRAKPGTQHGQRAAVYRLLNVAEEAMGSKQSGEPIKRKKL